MMIGDSAPTFLEHGRDDASNTSALARRPWSGQPDVSRCLVKRVWTFSASFRITLAAVLDRIGHRAVDRDVVTDCLLEFALEPIDLAQRVDVMADQGVKAAGCCSASWRSASSQASDQLKAGFDQAPLRLALAFADPD